MDYGPRRLIFLGGAEGNEPGWLISFGPTEKPGPGRPHDERGGETRREEERRGETRRGEERRAETDFEVPPLDPSDLKYHRFSLF